MTKDTIYRERAHGRWEYWTYVDGRKAYVLESWVEKEVRRGTIKLVDLKAHADRLIKFYRGSK